MTLTVKQQASLDIRFRLNMGRIAAIVRLLFSNDAFKPAKALGTSEGVRDDILRSSVVFLHATLEVVLRDHLPKPNRNLSFYSAADFDKAFRLSGIEPTPFRRLYPPLAQLAKRRKQIVHNADLDGETLPDWSIVDDWQLIMWLLTVPAFYFQFRISGGVASAEEARRADALQALMKSHVVFGEQLIAFPRVPPGQRLAALNKIVETLDGMVAVLNPTAA